MNNREKRKFLRKNRFCQYQYGFFYSRYRPNSKMIVG